jgi:hypothetical protein
MRTITRQEVARKITDPGRIALIEALPPDS